MQKCFCQIRMNAKHNKNERERRRKTNDRKTTSNARFSSFNVQTKATNKAVKMSDANW